jgi:hypothetical protein
MADEFLRDLLENREHEQLRREEWSDERRKAAISQYMNVGNNLHKTLALLLNPDTMQPLPGKEQQAAQIRQQLGQVDDFIKKLYDPRFNPDTGKVYEDPLHKLAVKLHLAKPPAQNVTAGEQLRALRAIQEKYLELPPAGMDTAGQHREKEQEIEWTRSELKKYNVPEDVIQGVTAAMLGGYKPTAPKQQWDLMQGTVGGKPVTWLRNKFDGSVTDLAGNPITPDEIEQFVGKEKPETASQVTMDAYENAFDPPVKWADMTPEQKAFYPRWKAMQSQAVTTGQHVVMVPQRDGSIVPVTVETKTEKSFPSAGAPAGLRKPGGEKTPGKQIRDLHSILQRHGHQAGVVSVGDAVGGRLTSDQTAARKEYEAAVKLDSIARQVALNPNDAVNQKRLAVALERASAGRFTTQALDYIIKAGWGNTIEQWANNPSTGALPADVIRQLVDGAHQNLKASKDALNAAMSFSTEDNSRSGRKPLSSFGR